MENPEPLSPRQARAFAEIPNKLFDEVIEPLHKRQIAHLAAFHALKQDYPDAAMVFEQGVAFAEQQSSVVDFFAKKVQQREQILQRFVDNLEVSALYANLTQINWKFQN